MAEPAPVPPLSSTDSSIVRMVFAVAALVTRMPVGCLVTDHVPSGLVTSATIRGGMRTPLLAMVW